jgi:hypothetical protein
MNRRRIRTEEVLIHLGVERRPFLERLRNEGLFEADELEPEQAEDLRLAKILMHELGVNAAGVDVALHLRRRLMALEARAQALVEELNSQTRPPDSDSSS